jgi:glycosyltransferase involved in cell wall biosynthesis
VFKRKSSIGRVLFSFLIPPFEGQLGHKHSVPLECYTAALIFDSYGYQVDAVDYASTIEIDTSVYDFIYGFGSALERSFSSRATKHPVRIAYYNGCNPSYGNLVSALRVKDVYKKTGIMLAESARVVQVPWRLQTILCDHLIVLGNSFVVNTYLAEDPTLNVSRLNGFFFDFYDIDLEKKDFNVARENFLWFGNLGAIHKGLDLLLNVFAETPELNLHICGLSDHELEFNQFYRHKIENSSNIINHGFVNLESDEFKKIMDLCGAIVFPSVSEGSPGSVLNVMANGGIIPIVSISTGLDVEDFGIVFSEISHESIRESIQAFMQLSDFELRQMAVDVKQHIRSEFSYQKYSSNLNEIIGSLIAALSC